MQNKNNALPINFFTTAYETLEEAEARKAEEAKADGTINPATGKPWTQKDVDAVAGRVRAETSKKLTAAEKRLQDLEQSNRLTAEERDALKTAQEELRSTYETETQMLARKAKETEAQYNARLQQAEEKAAKAQSRFEDSTIRRELTDAAAALKAVRPTQVVALLKPNSRLVELTDEDGKPTGEFVTKVKINSVDAKGKPTILDLPVADALKVFAELEDNFNLFQAAGTSGTGSSRHAPSRGGAFDPSKLTPAEYNAWRNTPEGKNA